ARASSCPPRPGPLRAQPSSRRLPGQGDHDKETAEAGGGPDPPAPRGGGARTETALDRGDAGSDELGFSNGRGRGLVTVRVGRNTTSRAAYYLRDQREIDDLLALLVALR